MRLPVSLKVTLVILVSLILQAVILVWYSAYINKSEMIQATEDDARVNVTRLQQTLSFLAQKQEVEQLQENVTALSTDVKVRSAYLVDEKNRIIASTKVAAIDKTLSNLLPPSDYDEINSRLSAMLIQHKAFLWRSVDDVTLYAIAPVTLGHKSSESLRADRIGYLVEIIDLGWIYQQLQRDLKANIPPMLLMMMVLTLLIIAYFYYSISKRLHMIKSETDNFVLGQPLSVQPVKGNDELSELYQSFVAMAGQINTQHNAIRENEDRLKNTQEIARLGTWELDLKNNQLYWSEEVYKMFGYMPNEFVATYEAFLDTVHPDDRKLVNDAYRDSLEQNSDSCEVDHRIVHHVTKEIRFVHERCEHVRDDAGNVIFSSGMVYDITERYQAEQSLRESEERFRQLAETIEEVFWLGSPDWSQVYYVSPAYEKVWGVPVENLLEDSMSWTSQLHPDDRDAVFKVIKEKSLGLDVSFDFPVYRIIRPDGSIRWVHARAYPVYDEDHNIVRIAGVAEDVTVKKQQEESLRQSQKMEALGKLTGGIAHDFNNMMAVVLGYAEILQGRFDPSAEEGEYVREIYRAGDRARKLTSKLLAFSRKKTSDAELCNINELLHEQQHMIEKTMTVQVHLIYELESKVWPVRLDVAAFEDSILNICINAMHAMSESGSSMPEGGKLIIGTRNVALTQNDAVSLELSKGDYVAISLRDTGRGMEEDTISKLFDPFFTTKGELGTGLGMTQVYGFVKQVDGAVSVESTLGAGTSITLYIPRALTDVPVKAGEVKKDATGNLTGDETILVVDDEPALVQLARTVLVAKGYNVLMASGGAAALQVLKSNSVDLLLSDIIMPGMNGYQLAAHVKQNYPHVKIQLMSGYSDVGDDSEIDDELKKQQLRKPVDATVMLQRIRSLMNKSNRVNHLPNRIMVMDDDKDMRDLFGIRLGCLGYDVVLASDDQQAIALFQQAEDDNKPINAAFLDMNIPGGMDGVEVAKRLLQINQRVKLIVCSGDPGCKEMQDFKSYGFHAAVEKIFEPGLMQETLDRLLNT